MPWHLYSYYFQTLTLTWPCYIRNTVRNIRATAVFWLRGKIKGLLYVKGTVFLPFSFRKKISTKQNIAFTEIAYQSSAPTFPVSRRNKPTNFSTSTDLFLPQRKAIYYINTNEIPGELSCENLVSSHVKITCYLHMWKYHHCYGYIINRAFYNKKLLKWNVLVVHWCLYNK